MIKLSSFKHIIATIFICMMIWFTGPQNSDMQVRVQVEFMAAALKVMMIFQSVKETVWNLLRGQAFPIIFVIGVNTMNHIFHRQLFWLGLMMLVISITITKYHAGTGVLVSGITKWNLMIFIKSMQQMVRQRVNTKHTSYDMQCGTSEVALTNALPLTITHRVDPVSSTSNNKPSGYVVPL